MSKFLLSFNLKLFLQYTLILCWFSGCYSFKAESNPTPKAYDLNHPLKIQLGTQLDEISGIRFYEKDSSVFAISDATGYLYKIFLGRKNSIQKWKFGKSADYEDLQLVDSSFYIMASNGNLTEVKFLTSDSLQVTNHLFPETGNNEFEAMFYDSATGLLNLICKDCEADNKKSVTVWSFSHNEKKYSTGTFSVNVQLIGEKSGLEKLKFKCSGAAINPVTDELYILSAVNNALVIADKNGNAKKVYPLNPVIYKQPEGIAFTPAGDLLISNESHKTGAPNLLVIKHKTVN